MACWCQHKIIAHASTYLHRTLEFFDEHELSDKVESFNDFLLPTLEGLRHLNFVSLKYK